MSRARSDHLLDETRRLLARARTLVEGSLGDGELEGRRADHAAPTVLSLYEELRARLDAIEEERIQELLGGIAERVDALNGLAGEVVCLRELRRALRARRSG